MNCVRFISSTTLCILLGIQAVSHSQYYSPHYNYDGEQDSGYYRSPSRNFEPSYRQQHHHYDEPIPVAAATSQYFGTINSAVPPKTDTTDRDANNPQQQSASLANYRIRFNNNPPLVQEYPPTNVYFYEPPPPSPNPPPVRPGDPRIGFSLYDQGQMNIYIDEREQPKNVGNGAFPIYTREQQRPPSSVNRGVPLDERQGRPEENGGFPSNRRNQQQPPTSVNRGVPFDERRRRPEENGGGGSGRTPFAMPRSPCPQVNGDNPRLYRKDGRCYIPGTNVSPCGPLMKFYTERDNDIYGDCDCVIDDGKVSRPLAYWEPHDRCYHLYERGPCRYSEWLILDRDGYPQCASRSCPQNFDDDTQKFWIRYRGKCYKTGEYYAAFCSVGQEDWGVYFPMGENQPKCLKEPVDLKKLERDPNSLSPTTELRCKPGYKKMQNGECKRIAKFDYDY